MKAHRRLIVGLCLATCLVLGVCQVDMLQIRRLIAVSDQAPTPEPAVTPIGQSGDWKLIFQDEFDGASLAVGHWVTCYWWGRQGCTIASNHELEWYQPDNVIVSDGVLKLRAQQQTVHGSDGNTYRYASGMVTTGRETDTTSKPVKFAFTYGYAEIRAKVPKGEGLWPAFWLLPANHNSKPEIDVMEIIGDQTNTAELRFHYREQDGDSADAGSSWKGPDLSKDWHTFAVDWQPDAIIWYIDGVERQRFTDQAHIPAQPMYMILNLAVGGDWPGAPDVTTSFPSDYLIDYVRVWNRN